MISAYLIEEGYTCAAMMLQVTLPPHRFASRRRSLLRSTALWGGPALSGDCWCWSEQDEGNVRKADVRREESERRQRGKLVKRAILEGDWAEVEKFCNKSSIRSMKNFLYCVYKQQYLELVDRQEYQKVSLPLPPCPLDLWSPRRLFSAWG